MPEAANTKRDYTLKKLDGGTKVLKRFTLYDLDENEWALIPDSEKKEFYRNDHTTEQINTFKNKIQNLSYDELLNDFEIWDKRQMETPLRTSDFELFLEYKPYTFIKEEIEKRQRNFMKSFELFTKVWDELSEVKKLQLLVIDYFKKQFSRKKLTIHGLPSLKTNLKQLGRDYLYTVLGNDPKAKTKIDEVFRKPKKSKKRDYFYDDYR